ncbi:MAG: PAS domain-containing protein [Pseudomonadota bacterium]
MDIEGDSAFRSALGVRGDRAGVEEMRHADNRELVRYWHALRGSRVCPMRAEVDPRRIAGGIANLFILEDLGRGNVRFRLAGSALVDAFWMELRGLPVQAIMAAEGRQSLRELVAETLAEPGIGMARLMRSGGRDAGMWELALLPLRSDRGQVDRVLGALNPLEPEYGRPNDPPLTFTIEEMSITPIQTVAEPRDALPGFGEPPAGWQMPDGVQPSSPQLREIMGGLAEGAEPRDDESELHAQRRAAFHIVRDQD